MAKKQKVYAVKAGWKPGIFDTWSACEASIKGYSCAEYKSFSSLSEAQAYLNDGNAVGTKSDDMEDISGLPEIPAASDSLTAYVDGSYDDSLQVYAFGCVFLLPDQRVLTYYGNGNEPDSLAMRNVSGEMLGAMYAVQFALKNGFRRLDICYDYAGIEQWAVGGWRTKKELTRKYAAFMHNQSKYIDVYYHKVAAHTNQKYNEMADQAAKRGLTEGKGIPDIEII